MLSCVSLRFCLLLFSFWVVFEGKVQESNFMLLEFAFFPFLLFLSLLPCFFASPDSGNKANNKNYIEQNQLQQSQLRNNRKAKGRYIWTLPTPWGGGAAPSPPTPLPLFIFKSIMPQVNKNNYNNNNNNNNNKNKKSNTSNSSSDRNSKIWPEENQWTTWATNENEGGQMTNRRARKIHEQIGKRQWKTSNKEDEGK